MERIMIPQLLKEFITFRGGILTLTVGVRTLSREHMQTDMTCGINFKGAVSRNLAKFSF